MTALLDWLTARGLEALAPVLEAQQIDLDVLPDLTDDDLKDLGVALGQRRRLLKAIAAARPAPPPVEAEPAAGPAERRQLSVLFVDLVGSTALSTRHDPEEMRQITRRYQDAVAGEIARFDGYVAKFMGDGVLVYFGWPKAHEDGAERAVRAALAAVAAVGRLRIGESETLAARAGIATGLVVVGDLVGHGSAQEASVVGSTPNIASRLQDLAQSGQVVIADTTQRLVQSSFDLVPLGLRSLKGLAAPLAVFAVQRERAGNDGRFDARAGRHLRPMVGREQELALLRERWSEVQEGEGQCLLLVGEAGIGKSRITRALRDVVGQSESAILLFQCSPYHLDSPLWPLSQQLTVAIRLSAADTPATRLDRIDAFLRPRAAHIESALPLVANLLGVPYDERYGPLNLSPQIQRSQTLATLVEQFLGLARVRPVLIVIEDVHWSDPSTLEFVHLVLDRIDGHRILLLLTSRPDGQPVLAGHPQVTRLVLNRLGRTAVEAMTAAIEGSDRLSEDVRREILTRTDGVPLFVEELTQALVELAARPRDDEKLPRLDGNLSVPATLHDSLMARLDRLPEVKRVAQVAGCIGRNFSHRMVAAVAGLPDADLDAALDRLVEAELVFRRGLPPDSAYTFKHALVRDAAANSLLRSEFRRINAGIVEAFEGFASPPPPELVARHAELAGLDPKAVDYLLEAGRRAIERYANHEAVNHLERALRLISSLPEGAERGALELRALAMIGVPRIALHGYAAASVEATYRRIVELAERVGDTAQLFQGLRGLWNCIYDRADIENAREVSERLCALARDALAAEAQSLAFRALGASYLSLGRFAEAIDTFERGMEACAGLPIDAGFRDHSEAPLVINGVYAGFARTIAGDFDRGRALIEEGLAVARRIENPLTLAFAYHLAANTQFMLGVPAECGRLSDESLRLAEEHRLVFWLAVGDVMCGWAATGSGPDQAAVARMRRGLHAWQASGAELHVPTWNAALAESLLATGAVDEAGECLDRALALAGQRHERFAVPILLRLKGLVADRRGDAAAAEALLDQAIVLAHEQGAGLYRLRAAGALAPLLIRRGARERARHVLAEACDGLRGGASLPCVTEARALLATLSQG
ncbi:ATP-binding protein [Reyranella sp.]|uniref:ATP-binding protein n=1 Tax=Reyranella sp. TaxID=1929291 RepID=UPI003BA90C4C